MDVGAGAPVTWNAAIEAFVVSRYDDIVAVTRRPTLFSSRTATGPVMARQLREAFASVMTTEPDVAALVADVSRRQPNGVLLNADPPVHSRQRALVNRAFSLRRVRAMEDDLVAVADRLIDEFEGTVDIVRDLAVPFPLTVIAQALGVPIERMDDFKRWSDDFVVAIGNHDLAPAELAAMLRSQAEFFAYFDGQISDRQAQPRDDLITDIVTARIDGEELTRPEMLAMFSQFLVAGNETTTKLIASAVLRLARDPATAAALRADPDAVAPFVEEVLRLDAPVQGLFRTATEDTTVGGVAIPAGAALWLRYAAGNRDGTHFEDPDALCPGRRGVTPHLAFGNGEHFCVGASLARAEARVAIQRLLVRFEAITVPVRDEELVYEPSYVLHGLHALPVRLAATITFATVDQDAPVAAVARAAYFAELDERFPDGFDAGGPDDAGTFVVVRDDDDVVGCGAVIAVDAETAEIKRMWIHPDWRGLGLGGRLLAHLEDTARQLGHGRVVLDTNATLTEAVALYRSSGYAPIERYNDNPYAELWFAKSLARRRR